MKEKENCSYVIQIETLSRGRVNVASFLLDASFDMFAKRECLKPLRGNKMLNILLYFCPHN